MMNNRCRANINGIVLALALLATGIAGEAQPKVLKEFKNAALVELSRDGHLILTSSFRPVKCVNGKNSCLNEVLTVYDNTSGKILGELISLKPSSYGIPNRFLPPEFVNQREVRTIESTWDIQRKRSVNVLLIWDPISRSEQRSPIEIEFPKDFWYQCPVNDDHLLGLGAAEIWPPYVPFERNGQKYYDMGDPANRVPHHTSRPLQLLVPGASTETIAVITDTPFPLNGQFKCKAWRSGPSYLIEDARSGNSLEDIHYGKSLSWFSTESGAPIRPCHTFEDQRIHGYAISPDASRITIITSALSDPSYRTFLTVLDGATCAEMSRFELEFPEKPRSRSPLLAPSKKYSDNVPFGDQFARSIAISPNNRLVAVAYGISKGISGLAFFGVYSMSDGHRMATLKGDTFTPNLYEIFMLDIYAAREAPINGALQFSPDSKLLATSSQNFRQWDVSKLH